MSKQNFQHKDFNQISSDFQELFPDASFHVVGDYSFLKLAQHAHSFSQIKAQHKKGSFEFKWWKLKLKSKIKNCKAIQIPNFTAYGVEMLIQPKRIDTVNGMKESVITKRLLEVELVNAQVWDITGEYSCADVVFNPSLNWIFELDESVQKMHVSLCNWLYKIEGVVQKADCSYYHAAASVFLRDFIIWNSVMKRVEVKKLYLVTHYHQEGLIAAAKNNGTRVIELQHGLISKNDLYYVYDDQYSEAIQNGFFADEFWCLGKYWSDKFKESAESNHIKFVVKGDYRWKGAAEVPANKENVIVITTQKNMARPYLQLIRSVEKILIDYPHWKCQVKLHPLESNSELYVNENYSQQIEILPKDVSIENVLSYAKIQISIYSTTFYDALGYNVFNLALINSGYSEDYVQEIVEEGIAASFQMMENPIERFQNEQTNSRWSRESVFSEYKV